MRSPHYDMVVAGAGPVGLATVIRARLQGLSAIAIEPRRHPEKKACGEGIMPRGRTALQEMGVALVPGDYAPFIGIRFIDGETVAEGRFASQPGWGVRRTTLWRAMATRATELGSPIAFGERVTGWRQTPSGVEIATSRGSLSAGILVGADGLHSGIRKLARLEGRRSRSARTGRSIGSDERRRFGMRRHYACRPWSSFVEVHWDDLAEAYVTPVGHSTVGVAILGRRSGSGYEQLLDRFPALRDALQGAPAIDRVLGAGPFDQRVRRRFGRGVALVGDAAGYVDPLTGEGLTLGFESAKALVEVVARGGELNEYERAYRRLSRTHIALTRGLLSIAARPALRRRAVSTLARAPELFDTFLAISAGEMPLRQVGLTGTLRALRSVLT